MFQVYITCAVIFFTFGIYHLTFIVGYPITIVCWLFIASLIGSILAIYFKITGVFMVCATAFSLWLFLQVSVWVSAYNLQPVTPVSVLGLYAGGVYLFGRICVQFRYKTCQPIVVLGVLISSGVLFWFSMRGVIMNLDILASGNQATSSWQIMYTIFCIACVTIFMSIYGTIRAKVSFYESLCVFALWCLCIVPLLMSVHSTSALISYAYQNTPMQTLTQYGVVLALIYNLSLFGLVMLLVWRGYCRADYVAAEVFASVLFILSLIKYTDWFYHVLDRSIFFLGAGILLLTFATIIRHSRSYFSSVPILPSASSAE